MHLNLFRQYIATKDEVETKSIASTLALIQQERFLPSFFVLDFNQNSLLRQLFTKKKNRNGDTVDRSLLKEICRMFISLQLYHQVFEKQFLDSTNNFYREEANNWLREAEVSEYLKHIEKRLNEESDRVLQYLDFSTKKQLISVCEQQLLQSHLDKIIEKGFDQLIQNDKKEDLRRMFNLFNRISALQSLRLAWVDYIKSTGTKLVVDVQKEKTLVQELLDLKHKLDVILVESLEFEKVNLRMDHAQIFYPLTP